MRDGTSLLRDNTLSQVVPPYETVFDPSKRGSSNKASVLAGTEG